MVRFTPQSLCPPQKETAVPVGQESGIVSEPFRTALLERQIWRIKRGKNTHMLVTVLVFLPSFCLTVQ